MGSEAEVIHVVREPMTPHRGRRCHDGCGSVLIYKAAAGPTTRHGTAVDLPLLADPGHGSALMRG